MDFDGYDNDTNPSEADYTAFVEWLSESTANELRQVRGDPTQQRQVLCRYYRRGEQANLTAGELIDFLGVSTPSILDRAGYDDLEGDEVMAISDSLTDEEISRTILPERA